MQSVGLVYGHVYVGILKVTVTGVDAFVIAIWIVSSVVAKCMKP